MVMGLSWSGWGKAEASRLQMSPGPCSPPTEALAEGQPLLLLAEPCTPL